MNSMSPPDQDASQDERDAWRHIRRMRMLEEGARAGMRTMFMHLSALKQTTRKSHAERHGKLFSASEVRDFWNNPENRADCACTIAPIPVDQNGEPLIPIAMDNAKKT